MLLNLDNIWNNISQYQGLSHPEYVELNRKLGVPHTHSSLIMDVISSSKFKSYLSSHTQYFQSPQFWHYGWDKISYKLLELENYISGLEEIKEENFYPFIDLLIEFFSIKTIRLPNVCTFSPWKYKSQGDLEDLKDLVQKISKLYPLLGTKSITNEQISEVYRGIYIHGWGCIEIGEFEVAIYLSKFLYDLSNSAISSPELKIKIPQCPNNNPYQHKSKFSSGLILGKAYGANGNIKEAIQIYKDLLHTPPGFTSGYSFLTRRLEVSLEVFKLHPSKEHKKLVFDHFQKSLKQNSINNYTQERTREKCLIVLYLLNILYNYKLL